MIQTTFREMKPEERAALEQALKKARPGFEINSFSRILGFAVVLGFFALLGFLAGTFLTLVFFLLSKLIPALAFLSAPAAVQAFQIAGALAGLFGIPLLLYISMRQGSAPYRANLKKDLQEGRVELMRVTAEGAVRRPLGKRSREDDLFFMDTGKSQILFLTAWHFQKQIKEGEFPSAEFELVRGRHSREILQMNVLGGPLKALDQDFDLDLDRLPLKDGDVFAGKLGTLESDLKKLAVHA
jgi:hypothetical protein